MTVLFEEKHCAAQSQANVWTKMASSINSINVTVTSDRISIQPTPLVGWLVRVLALDLHHDIPPIRVTAVQHTGDWHGYGKVMLTYQRADRAQDRSVLLYLKNHGAFINAVNEVRSKD